MQNLLSKSTTTILLGIVFFLSGTTMASAATPSPDKVQWAFEYKLTPNLFVKIGAFISGDGSTPEITNQIQSYTTQATCAVGEASYASDSDYAVTRSCYQTTTAALTAARSLALANIQNADFNGDPLLKNLNCNITDGKIGEGSLADCFPIIIYYVVYKPASWFLVGAGYTFDAMLTLSIDSNFVNQGFIDSTWIVVRDFSNMLFIFILLYAGVQTILGAKDWRDTILKVIIMALLINFSLFFTKVVIDAGNILAVGVYNSMGVVKSAENQSFQITGAVAERDVSGILASSFQPQRFLDTAGKVNAVDATIVFLVATVVSGYAGYIFFMVAILFIGRLIAFWFLMIVSPFAFISIALPSGANKFQSWLSELLNQAFVAPVFLFLIYLIMQVVNAGDGLLVGLIKTSPTTVGAFTFDKVLAPVVVATFLVLALQKALGFAKSMSGGFGDFGSKIAGTALGITTGGASLVGRGVIGGAAAYALKKGLVSSESHWGGRARALTKASFDVKNIGGKDSVFGKTIGGGIAKGIKEFGAGAGTGVGGIEKVIKEREKKADTKAREAAERSRLTPKERFENAQASNIASSLAQAAKNEVKERTAAVEVSTKKATEAKVAVDTMRNSGKLDPGLSKVLEAAKKEEEEAKEVLEKATIEAQEAEERAEVARKKTEEESTARREIHAEKAEKAGLYETAEKIRKGTPIEKENALDKLKREMKEEFDKEAKEKEKSAEH